MCRFTCYIGESILIHNILFQSKLSLVNQCKNAIYGMQVNMDGCGVAWYVQFKKTPAIYRSMYPMCNDLNIASIANHTRSTCFIGHIRAATQGMVCVNNCHPFHYDNLTFCHNGNIDNFDITKRSKFYDFLKDRPNGNTDSELLFCLCIFHYKKSCDELLALKKTINTIKAWNLEGSHSFCLTNGNTLFVGRTKHLVNRECPTLYYSNNKTGLIISSEPCNENTDWLAFPENSISICRDMTVHTELFM